MVLGWKRPGRVGRRRIQIEDIPFGMSSFFMVRKATAIWKGGFPDLLNNQVIDIVDGLGGYSLR